MIRLQNGSFAIFGIYVGMDADEISKKVGRLQQKPLWDPFAFRYEVDLRLPDGKMLDGEIIIRYNMDRLVDRISLRVDASKDSVKSWIRIITPSINSASDRFTTATCDPFTYYRFVSEKDELVITYQDMYNPVTKESRDGVAKIEITRRVYKEEETKRNLRTILKSALKI